MTQIMIDIDNAVMNVYRAEAERRGMTGVELIAALLADWPAILAPTQQVQPPEFIAVQDFPSGAAF